MANDYRFDLGHLLVVLRDSAVQFHPISGDGFSPDHLSVFFEPIAGSRELTPHLSPHKRKRFYFHLSLRRLERFGDEVKEKLRQRWISNSRPVALHDLETEGWEILLLDERFVKGWLDVLKGPDGRYRLADAGWDRLARESLGQLITPKALSVLPPPKTVLTAVREVNGRIESNLLGHYPAGLAHWRPGWFFTNLEWLPPKETARIMFDAGGRELKRGLIRVARFLRRRE